MGKPLSEELIKQKTRQDSLNLIRNLNLWGQDIDDLKVLKGMPNLEVLSLSVNKITTLKDIEYCHKLQELYLRKNSISDISEIKYISQLKQLKVLWLSDNPCATTQNYREIVIKALPYLEKLDNINITQEDRVNCQHIELDFLDNTNSNSNGNNKYPSYQNQQQQQYDPSPANRNYDYNSNYNENNNNQVSSNNYAQQYQQSSATRSNNYNTRGNPSTVVQNNYQQSNYEDVQQMNNASQFDDQMVNRNSNIVCAILSLVKELDYNSLEIIRRDVERKIGSLQKY